MKMSVADARKLCDLYRKWIRYDKEEVRYLKERIQRYEHQVERLEEEGQLEFDEF